MRIRGVAPEDPGSFTITVKVNGTTVHEGRIELPGLFVIEPLLKAAPEHEIEIAVSPVWQPPGDSRRLSVNLSLLRLQSP